MFDLQTQTFRTVVPAVAQMIVKDPVALMPRKEPNTLTNTLSATAPNCWARRWPTMRPPPAKADCAPHVSAAHPSPPDVIRSISLAPS